MQLAPLTVTEIKAADACRIERAPFSCDVAVRPTPRREAGASTSRGWTTRSRARSATRAAAEMEETLAACGDAAEQHGEEAEAWQQMQQRQARGLARLSPRAKRHASR